MIAKYLATSFAIENVVSAPRVIEELLPDLDDLDQLGRVRVQVDHVAGLARRLGARVHRDPDVGGGEGGSVVRAVARHRHELTCGLLAPDQRHLVLRLGLGEEVVDARLLCDRPRGQRVVARDHHGADAHRPELREALPHSLLDHVLEVDHAERRRVARDHERRPAGHCDPLDDRVELGGTVPPAASIQRLIASAAPLRIARPSRSTPLIRVSAVNGISVPSARSPLAQAETLLRQHDDRAALRRLVGEARELGRVGEVGLVDARQGEELGRLPVAERDRARLVEQQRRAVTCRFDGPSPRGRARCGERADPCRRSRSPTSSAADRRRDQRDEQRDEDDHLLFRARVDGEGLQRDDGEQEDDRQSGEQDVERDLVRRLLPFGALDERDHAVEEALARLRRHSDGDPIREDARASGDGRAVAARLADHGRRLAGDRRLVDARDPVDHLAVGGDHLPGHDDHLVARPQLRARDGLVRAVGRSRRARSSPRASGATPRPGPCPRPSAIASAKLANSTVNQSHTAISHANTFGSRDRECRDEQAADLDDEHDRVAGHPPRVELAHAVAARPGRGSPGRSSERGSLRSVTGSGAPGGGRARPRGST